MQVTWQMDLDWFITPPPRATICPLCNRDIYTNKQAEHTDWVNCTDKGLAPEGGSGG
jgi:hypothetical protein